jgi:hypothetical protein
MRWIIFSATIIALIALSVAQRLGGQSAQVAASTAPVVINFDNLPAGGPGTPATVTVISQYADKGVTFNGPVALDYSKGLPIPGFAHSGSIAIEQCYSQEFCSKPIEMSFTRAQRRVKVWVGFHGRLDESRTVLLSGFDSSRSEVTRATVTLPASPGLQPIRTPLEITSPSENISRATVSFDPITLFTNGLAVDDVEFDLAGPPPPCEGIVPPTVTITSPPNEAEFNNANSILLEGSISNEQKLSRVTVIVTSERGEQRRFSLFDSTSKTPPDFIFGPTSIEGALYAGRNTIEVEAENECRKVGKTSVHMTYLPPFPSTPPSCVPGQPTNRTINFEEFDVGTPISTQYFGTAGAVFPTFLGVKAPVIAVQGGNRVLQLSPLNSTGPVVFPLVVQFSEPQKSVRLLGGLISGGVGVSAILKAYNRQNGGQLVGQSTPAVVTASPVPFEVKQSSQGDIYRIEFELSASGVQYIDNLELERECSPQPSVPETVDLFVHAIEITQATNLVLIPQDRPPSDAFFNTIAYGGVPLVKDRHTVVRVYAGIKGGNLPATGINARLFGFKGSGLSANELLGALEPLAGFYGPAGQTITINPTDSLTTKRSDIQRSWNFRLPLEWTEQGPIKLVAEINRPTTVGECTEPVCFKNDELTVYNINFVTTYGFTILPVTISELRGRRTTPHHAAQCTFWDLITFISSDPDKPGERCSLNPDIQVDRQKFFQGVYPIREGGIDIRPIAGHLEYDGNPSFDDILADMRRKFGGSTIFGIPKAQGYVPGLVYYGLAPSGGSGGTSKQRTAYATGMGGFQQTAAHEVGHTLGRKHAGTSHDEQCAETFAGIGDSAYHCEPDWPYPHGGIGEFGFDTRNWQVIDPSSPPSVEHAHDLMSYGDTTGLHTQNWTSPRNYCRAINDLGGGSSAYCDSQRELMAAAQVDAPEEQPLPPSSEAPPKPALVLAQPQEYLMVRGRISRAAEVEFFPFYRLILNVPPDPPPAQSPFSIEAQDRNGQTLLSQKFELQVPTDGGNRNFVDFLHFLPFTPAMERVVFKRSDQVIAVRTRSANAPAVQVLTPNGGESWGQTGMQTIAWQAQDADAGDSLFYEVQYSWDGGKSWVALVTDFTGTNFATDVSELPGGDQALVRVLASDGFNFAQDQSNAPFKVAKKAPQVAITGLRDINRAIPNNVPLTLTAAGTDPEDGPLPDQAFRWTSDDGLVVTGRYFNVHSLSLGQRAIILMAKDRDGVETATTLPKPLTIIQGQVSAPACCTLNLIAQQDTGATLTASLSVMTPPLGARTTPINLNLEVGDRLSIAAPAAIGNLRFLHWRSVTNNRVLTTDTTLTGVADQSETLAAVYQLPTMVTFRVTSICEGCATGPAPFPGLAVNVVTPALGVRTTPFDLEFILNSRAVITAPATSVVNGKTARFKRWVSVTDNRVITTHRTLSGRVDKAETVAAVYQ